MPKGDAEAAAHALIANKRDFRALCAKTRAALRRVAGAKLKKHRNSDVEFFALLVMTAAGVSAAICAPEVGDAETVDLGKQDVAFVRAHDEELDTIASASCAAARSQSQKWWHTFVDWCLNVKSCRKAARRFVHYGLGPLCKQLLMIEARRGRPHGALARYLALVCGAPLFGSAHYSLLAPGKRTLLSSHIQNRSPVAASQSEAKADTEATADVNEGTQPKLVMAMGAPSASAASVPSALKFALTPSERNEETAKVMDAIAVYVHVKSFAGCTCELLTPSLQRLDDVMHTITNSSVRAVILHAVEAAAMAVAPQLHHDETTLPRPLQNLLELLMATTAIAGSQGYQAYAP
jgi:hypothetical protein